MEKKVTTKEINEALHQTFGNVSAAARRLGIDRRTIYYRMEEEPEIKDIRKTAEEGLKDVAEAKLSSLINSGNLGAICFFLKCKAKDRGYIEKSEYAHTVSGEINLSVYMPDNNRATRRVKSTANGNGKH